MGENHGTGKDQDDFASEVKTGNFKKVELDPIPTQQPANTPDPALDEKLKRLELLESSIESKLKLFDESIKQSSQSTQQVDLAREIAKALREEKGPYRPEEIDDEEDYEEVGTAFFCFSAAMFIGDDMRKGRIVFPPKKGLNSNDLIEFKFEMSKMIKSGRQVDIVLVSKFVSYSKKLTKWLKEHSQFGSVFFERLPAKLDHGSVTFARAMARNAAYLKDLSAPQLKNRCRDMGVMVSEDPEVMRNELAITMTKSDFVMTEDERLIPKELYARIGSQFNEEDKAEMLEARKTRGQGYGGNYQIQGEKVDVSIS